MRTLIEGYSVEKNDVQDVLTVNLKYVNGESAIQHLKRISRPGVRKYRGYRDIKAVRSGLGIAVFSTPVGVITGKNAREQKVGGEYICEIY